MRRCGCMRVWVWVCGCDQPIIVNNEQTVELAHYITLDYTTLHYITSSVRIEGTRMANPKVVLEPSFSATREAGTWPKLYPQKKADRVNPFCVSVHSCSLILKGRALEKRVNTKISMQYCGKMQFQNTHKFIMHFRCTNRHVYTQYISDGCSSEQEEHRFPSFRQHD
jgi:hypothetical protein